MTEPSPSTEPAAPTRATRRFLLAAVVTIGVAVALAVTAVFMTAPWGGEKTFASAELFAALSQIRQDHGQWPKDQDDPNFRLGPRLEAIGTPVRFRLQEVETSRPPLTGETAVYRVEIGGEVWTMRPRYTPEPPKRQEAPTGQG